MGGWIGARFGLQRTLYGGLILQILALGLLSQLNPDWPVALSVAYVVAAQGLAGIAKDLTKMSAKKRREIGDAGRSKLHFVQMGCRAYGL